MGLIGGMARTAVVAGTATAVSNRVSRRQSEKWADQDQYAAYQAQQGAPQQAPPPQQYQQPPPPPQYQEPPQYQQAPPPPPPAPVVVVQAADAAPGTNDKLAQLQQL